MVWTSLVRCCRFLFASETSLQSLWHFLHAVLESAFFFSLECHASSSNEVSCSSGTIPVIKRRSCAVGSVMRMISMEEDETLERKDIISKALFGVQFSCLQSLLGREAQYKLDAGHSSPRQKAFSAHVRKSTKHGYPITNRSFNSITVERTDHYNDMLLSIEC
eukprot:scaffold227_cov97-Cylindrotheca_fusiformis.AAC.1